MFKFGKKKAKDAAPEGEAVAAEAPPAEAGAEGDADAAPAKKKLPLKLLIIAGNGGAVENEALSSGLDRS